MESILVPTDFSPVSLNALHFAADFCVDHNCKLCVLNVMSTPTIDSNAGIELVESLMQNLQIKTKNKLGVLKDELSQRNSLEIEILCQFGMGSDVIVEVTKKLGIDYIFMGTSGASGILNTLLGSVTLYVSRKSEVPVLAIPKHAEYNGFENIVFGNDHKESLKPSIDLISGLKTGEDVKLTVISVDPSSEEYSEEIIFDTTNFKEVSIWSKSISLGIKQYLESEKADLLVLKHRDRNGIQQLFQKSTTKELLMECTVPLLILN